VKVCVFGAGAIGGYLGVCLARSGAEVSLVARGPHLEAMRARGLRLQYDAEEHVAHLRCTDNATELGEQDYLIIGLKAHQIDEAVDAMIPLLGSSTCIVTASNGIPYWYFHGDERLSGVHFRSIDPGGRQWDRLGPERAIGCVVFPAAEVVAPGVIRHEHGRKFPIGEPGGQKSPRVERLHEAMVAGGLDAPIREDIRDEIWLKLCGNLCFNPISALTLATIDIIASDPGTRAICRAMMLEAKAIGDYLGLRLRVDVERRIDGAGTLGPHKMSMLQDLERGRSMEVEPLVGVVQELGVYTGIPTPTTNVVLALIRQRAQYAPGSLH
jgi:2-dehydropantoate 2-reductase